MSIFLKKIITLNPKYFKFIGAGTLNTIFGYSIYALLISLDITYLYALFFSTLIGVIFNYFSFGHLVFNSTVGLVNFLKFVLTYTFIYFVNVMLLKIVIVVFDFGLYGSQAFCLPVIISVTWFLMHYWVFKNER